MKIITYCLLLMGLLLTGSCKKDEGYPATQDTKTTPPSLSLSEAKAWYQTQPQTQRALDWRKATYQPKGKGSWRIRLEGSPRSGLITGWREISIQKNADQTISGLILEYLPDGIYLQQTKTLSPETYSGRVFIRNLNNQLLGGYLYADGKPVGNIDPDPRLAKDNLLPLNVNSDPKSGGKGKLSYFQISESCAWIPGNYIDGNGEVVIHSERICSYNITPVSVMEPLDALYNYSGGGGDGGDGNAPTEEYPTIPEVSNLPGQDAPKVDPKKMTKCFGAVPDNGATVKVHVYVQEPFPGTAFNIGPNSVGHVTIGITKTNGAQSVTQVMGFYPEGRSIFGDASVIRNNGNLDINVSAGFTISTDQLTNLLAFYNSPPATYSMLTYNCTNFVYDALSAGGMSIPDPTVAVSLGGPAGAVDCMTPAGLGQVFRRMKEENPKRDIDTNDGFTPASEGECD